MPDITFLCVLNVPISGDEPVYIINDAIRRICLRLKGTGFNPDYQHTLTGSDRGLSRPESFPAENKWGILLSHFSDHRIF
jgi:hypothetical protein